MTHRIYEAAECKVIDRSVVAAQVSALADVIYKLITGKILFYRASIDTPHTALSVKFIVLFVKVVQIANSSEWCLSELGALKNVHG